MEKSDQAEIDEAEIGQPLTSERNSSSESDSEEIVKSFTKLSIYPPINTISVKKAIIGETIRALQRNRERLLESRKEQIRVSLFHSIKKGDAVSFEKYIQLLQEKFKDADITRNHYEIRLPRDIELAKEASEYSVDEIENLNIEITKLNENVVECLHKLLRSFAYTQICNFLFRGYYVCPETKKRDSNNSLCESFLKVYHCSNFFEELSYVVSRASNEIQISKLELSSKEFIQLVKAAKKSKELRFMDCKISFDSESDFGPMESCLIEKIEICYLYQVYDERREYEECLMRIFRGILKCTNLIGSLKVLGFYCSKNLKQEMIETAKVILGEEYSEIMPSLKKFIDC